MTPSEREKMITRLTGRNLSAVLTATERPASVSDLDWHEVRLAVAIAALRQAGAHQDALAVLDDVLTYLHSRLRPKMLTKEELEAELRKRGLPTRIFDPDDDE